MLRPSTPKRLVRPLLLALMLLAPVAAVAAQTTPATPAKPAAGAKPAAPAAGNAAPAKPDDPVVAIVDGIKVHVSDVAEQQREMGQRGGQMDYAELLDRQVGMTLFLEAGRADKLANDPEVKENLARLEDRVITEVYIQRVARAAVTPDALKERYAQLVKDKQGTEEIHARHILVKTEAEAKDIIAQLAKGADFVKLANDKSEEKGGNGGDLGYFTRDKMVPAFSDAAFALKKGETSPVPVQTQFGWHVIKVEDRRVAQPPTFEEVAPQLRQEIANEAVQRKLHALHDKAKIEEFNSDGSPVPPGGKPSVPGQEKPADKAPAGGSADLPTPGAAPAPAPAAAPDAKK